MAANNNLQDLLTSVADAIREKKGSTDLINPQSFATEIANLPSGGVPEYGVFFTDYDGSIVEVWDLATVSGRSELPTNPTHEGLVAQGWNWDLQHIKLYVEDDLKAKLWVGQMYKTASGLTEFDVSLTKSTGLYVIVTMKGNKVWGDGTQNSLTYHTYSDYGDYTITCDGTTITSNVFSAGVNDINYYVLAVRISDRVTNYANYAFAYLHNLAYVTLPQSSITDYGNYLFGWCPSLHYVTIPIGVTSMGMLFYECYTLRNVSIPQGLQQCEREAFHYCYSLNSVSLPLELTSLVSFSYCYSLTSITIKSPIESFTSFCSYCYNVTEVVFPSSTLSIGLDVFSPMQNIKLVDLSRVTSVVTLSSSISKYNKSVRILVPASLYQAWIVATNWNTLKDNIEPV